MAPAGSSAPVASVLRDLGALGVLAQALDDTRSTVSALFDGAEDRRTLLDRVRMHVARLADLGIEPPSKIRVSALTGDDWAETWPEYSVPVAAGRRLLIVPAWFDTPASDRITIVLDGGGFGTGHHPSTAGCLQGLEAIADRERVDMAIDLGTGSGILAIAAALLGVPRVTAVDSDAGAVRCAAGNAERNRVSDRVRCLHGDASAVALDPAPLVVANLLAPVHGTLAVRYPGLVTPGGWLVLGGIQDAEAGAVVEVVAREGLALRERITIRGWTTLVLAR